MKRALLSLIVIGLLFAACDDVIIEPPERTPATPTDCAYFLEVSFNTQDIQLYKSCLSPDFTFYFDPEDVGRDIDGYIIPESWDYEEDWNAVHNMFTDAYDVSFNIAESEIGNPEEGETEYLAEDIPVQLLVMIDENNGFNGNGICDFTFGTYDSNGQTYWRIKDWWDGRQTGGERGFSTIGIIKVLFKEGKPG